MKKETLTSKQGYDIVCHNNWTGEEKVLIACHGFGSSKDGLMIQALNRYMPVRRIGVFSFDFPSHGESPVWQEALRVPYCIEDLAAVEVHVRTMAPKAEILYFASSFGAYIMLNYLASHSHTGRRAFLRSSAVAMPKVVEQWVGPKERALMERQGYFVPDYDYVREMRVTPAFLKDLEEYDIFSLYRPGETRLRMIHGGRDSVAPLADARRFAEIFGVELMEIPGGEHDLMGEGELERVLKAAVDFFQ